MDFSKYSSINEVIAVICHEYISQKGTRKLNKLINKVIINNKLSGLISRSRYYRFKITARELLSHMNESIDFIFISNYSQACAAALFYARWNEEVNNELHLCSEQWIINEIHACYQYYNIQLT